MPGGAWGAGEEHGAEGRVLPQETPVPGRGGDARTAHTAAMGAGYVLLCEGRVQGVRGLFSRLGVCAGRRA